MFSSVDHRLTHPAPALAAVLEDERDSVSSESALESEKGELLINPRYHFDRPSAVLRSPVLNHEEKIDVLKSWADSLWTERQPALVPFQVNPLAGSKELDEVAGVLAQLHALRLKAA